MEKCLLTEFSFKFGVLVVLLLGIIGCTDDPENTPPTAEGATVVIDENTRNGTIIFTISAKDIDGDEIRYTIVEGNIGNVFEVDERGNVIVKDQRILDFEMHSLISLTIEVSDGLSVATIILEVVLNNLNEETRPLTNEENEIVNYFVNVALGFEFGGASEVTRKWQDTMKIYVAGIAAPEIFEELDKIVTEINALVTDGFYIQTNVDSMQSNASIFFGSGDEYARRYTPASPYTSSNWGLFFVSFNSDNYITYANLYVDIERADLAAQKHLLREELTQSLGLAKDSNQYRNSIFYSNWTTTSSYAPIDTSLIKLLYHPWMTTNLSEAETRDVLTKIIIED